MKMLFCFIFTFYFLLFTLKIYVKMKFPRFTLFATEGDKVCE